MTPESVIQELDLALAFSGEDVRLVRYVLGPNGLQIPIFVDIRIRFPNTHIFSSTEIPIGLSQGNLHFIMSPTEITRAGWPGPDISDVSSINDPRILRVGDQFICPRGTFSVNTCDGIRMGSTLVRLEGFCRGS